MVSERFFLCFIFSITLKSVCIFLMQAVSTLVRNSFYLLQCKPLWSAVNWQKKSRMSSMRQHWRVRGFRQIPGCSKGAVKNLQKSSVCNKSYPYEQASGFVWFIPRSHEGWMFFSQCSLCCHSQFRDLDGDRILSDCP